MRRNPFGQALTTTQRPAPRLAFDIAVAMDQGKRSMQQDALAHALCDAGRAGFVVLADGMGGHPAGDMASTLAVAAIRDCLREATRHTVPRDAEIAALLRRATLAGNAAITRHAAANAGARGMGTTLVLPFLAEGRLHWASVGDSLLLLYRGGALSRVNETHTLAMQLDFLASAGVLDPEVAINHPDRDCLTSALCGDDIPRIDCGAAPLDLAPGDIVIAASDGLLFLDDSQILGVLAACADAGGDVVAEALMAAIRRLDHPCQDNVSIAIITASAAAR